MSKRSIFDALRGNSAGTWWTRAGVALFAGLVVGVGGGFLGLRILRGDTVPTPVPEVEPEPAAPAPRRTYSGPRADGMRRQGSETTLVGGGSSASRDSLAVVPDLVGRAEGDARRLLERAGFTLGEILFRQADERLGTVLETFPVPGERVQLPATINLILADRRRVIDSIPYGYSSDTTSDLSSITSSDTMSNTTSNTTSNSTPDTTDLFSDSSRVVHHPSVLRPNPLRPFIDTRATRPDSLP